MKIQNINFFLTACSGTFGLKPADLFAADDLYYGSAFQKVCSLGVLPPPPSSCMAVYEICWVEAPSLSDRNTHPPWYGAIADAQVVTTLSLLSKTQLAGLAGFQ